MGTKFHINGSKELYYLTDTGMWNDDGFSFNNELMDILRGNSTINIPPFKPVLKDTYYYFDCNTCKVEHRVWNKQIIDYTNYFTGNCYATEELALRNGARTQNNMVDFYNEH